MGMFRQSTQKTCSHSKSCTWQTTVDLLYEPATVESGADHVMVSQVIGWGQMVRMILASVEAVNLNVLNLEQLQQHLSTCSMTTGNVSVCVPSE